MVKCLDTAVPIILFINSLKIVLFNSAQKGERKYLFYLTGTVHSLLDVPPFRPDFVQMMVAYYIWNIDSKLPKCIILQITCKTHQWVSFSMCFLKLY